MSRYVLSAAEFSSDHRYRYSLTRRWQRDGRTLVVCGLNPSKAGATDDDHTVRKWVGFGKRLGFGGFIAVNLFSFVATDPKELVRAANTMGSLDIVGRCNDMTLVEAGEMADRIVVCWGVNDFVPRARLALKLLNNYHGDREFWCWGRTRDGHPRHPLRLAYSTPLERFEVPA